MADIGVTGGLDYAASDAAAAQVIRVTPGARIELPEINLADATLTLVRNGGANVEDLFSATGTLSALNEGGSLVVGAATIGTVTTNSGGTLVLTFNSNATNTLVNQAMQQIAYSNTSDTPPPSVQIDWTFDDGNIGAQGSGAALAGSGSTTVTITPTNDVRKGDELAFAPAFQGNLRARYEWDLDNGWLGHVMPSVSFSSDSYSDIITINRDKIDGWFMAGVTAGVTTDTWSAELYVTNLTDERAEVSRNFVFDARRVTYAQPRTIGVRMSWDF